MTGAVREEMNSAHEAEMAGIQSKLDELKSGLLELQGARSHAAEMIKTNFLITCGAVVISVIVMSAFGIMLYITATYDIPASQKDNVSGLLWTLNTLAVAVVSYWVGSSAGAGRGTLPADAVKTRK